jgi:hypothetical protein
VTELFEERVLAAVIATPGATSNAIVVNVGARRQRTLRTLRRLERDGLVYGVRGARGSITWFPTPQPSGRFPRAPERFPQPVTPTLRAANRKAAHVKDDEERERDADVLRLFELAPEPERRPRD